MQLVIPAFAGMTNTFISNSRWDNDALLLLVRNGLVHGQLWKQLMAKTKELDIAVENLERVQTEILKAFV